MRLPWHRSKDAQLDLLDAEREPNAPHQLKDSTPRAATSQPASVAISPAPPKADFRDGRPMQVAVSLLYEDGANPRTEFPEAELNELAENIGQHGILQPIVVHPADEQGRHRIHFGAKRWRAAQRAGLAEVPVVVRDTPADPYTQVAENQKRHGLTPLDLARFIRGRVEAGDSNATIAKRLGMNLTSVAHHLALLDLPPALEAAMHSGRCTSPRTLHELSKLHEQQPEQVKAWVDGPGDITREMVATLRERVDSRAASPTTRHIAQAVAACDRLAKLLGRIDALAPDALNADLAILRMKVVALSRWSPRGSDGQTP